MKISKLIERLQKLKKEYGDLKIHIDGDFDFKINLDEDNDLEIIFDNDTLFCGYY